MSTALDRALAHLNSLDPRIHPTAHAQALDGALVALANDFGIRLSVLEKWSSGQTVTDDPAATLAPRPPQGECMVHPGPHAEGPACHMWHEGRQEDRLMDLVLRIERALGPPADPYVRHDLASEVAALKAQRDEARALRSEAGAGLESEREQGEYTRRENAALRTDMEGIKAAFLKGFGITLDSPEEIVALGKERDELHRRVENAVEERDAASAAARDAERTLERIREALK